MGIGGDLAAMNQPNLEAMKQQLQEANDRGFERSRSVQEAARQKKLSERQHRKRLLYEQHFSKLPQLFEDAVANGEETFEFFPVNFCDVMQCGMGKYDPKPGSDAELVMELLKELNLIADIEGNRSDARDINDAHVRVQSKLFE